MDRRTSKELEEFILGLNHETNEKREFFDDLYFIYSFEHEGFWKPLANGYSPNIAEAGIYYPEHARNILNQAHLFKTHEIAIQIFSKTGEELVPLKLFTEL